MHPQHTIHYVEHVEILESEVVSLEALARLCSVSPAWLQARLEADVLPAEWRQGKFRVSAESLWRVRQLMALEAHFDADPHLAGLVTDLMIEVRSLRRRLAALDGEPNA